MYTSMGNSRGGMLNLKTLSLIVENALTNSLAVRDILEKTKTLMS